MARISGLARPEQGVHLDRYFLHRLPSEGWRRNLLALTAASFMTSVGFIFVMPLLPLLMAELVGGDSTAATAWSGLAFGISPLMGAALAPIWGWIGDRYGYRLMLLRALGAIGLLMGLMGFATSSVHLVILRGAIGALGAFSPAAMGAIAATTPRQETGRAIGLLQASQVAGSVVGPLIGGLLADQLGLRAPFLVVAGLFAIAFLLVYRLYQDLPSEHSDPTAAPAAARKPGVSTLWVLLATLFAVQFADGTFGPLLPLYLRSLGVPPDATASLAGLTVSLGALGAALSSYWAPRLGGRRMVSIIQGGLMGAALLSLPVALATSWWQIPPLRALIGFLSGGILTLSYTLATRRVGRGRAGTALGMLSSAAMIGWACGPLTTAALSGTGPRVMFVLNAILFALCASAWLVERMLVRRRHVRRIRNAHKRSARPAVEGDNYDTMGPPSDEVAR